MPEELLPPLPGAPGSLLLFRPKACSMRRSSRARWGERKGHHTRQIVGRIVVRKIPRVGQRFVRLDGEYFAAQHAALFAAKIETVTHDRLEIVLHEPLCDQVRLREGTPEFFRWMGDFTFDNDGARFGQCFVHWSK